MIVFILNNETIRTELPSGMTVLDFVRYHKHLKGTKIGCREGDCGACNLLVGELKNERMHYQTMTSCLIPLGNAAGKHIVTVEGINHVDGSLTPVQNALVEENGTQCGFCTVGFVMSLTCHCVTHVDGTYEEAVASVDGNICRCTGYKSIERAAMRITNLLQSQDGLESIPFAIENNIVPEWFSEIPGRLHEMHNELQQLEKESSTTRSRVSGGTDLYVQKFEDLIHEEVVSLFKQDNMRLIHELNDTIEIGSSATVTDLLESEVMQKYFPNLKKHLKLVSSTPIRNMATVAGNLVNASPIGDLTIWFLAMDAMVVLKNGKTREIPLKDFYQGYKVLAKTADEIVDNIYFAKPGPQSYFNFEKVSKRTFLDIATVNTAIYLKVEGNVIKEAHVSAGGVAPIPLYLKNLSSCLFNKTIPFSEEEIEELDFILDSEISPVSDVRGSADYKRLLLRQLFHAHFGELFPVT